MRIVLLTNEYPPNVYGGAGVHVEYLTRELARLEGGAHRVRVLCFGNQQEEHANLSVRGVEAPAEVPVQDPRHARLMDTLLRDLVMAGAVAEADVLHAHTWYAHLAGCLAKQLTGARLVLTTHSLEPHRPWKAEQLGSAYRAAAWIERTAYENADGVVAVSEAMKADVEALYGLEPARVRTIHNGIDAEQYRPRPDPELLRRRGVDPDVPIVLFVGRITRQKGILHLVRALPQIRGDVQVVLLAGAPDTPEIAAEMEALVEAARAEATARIVWIPEMLPREEVIAFYSHATLFVCPSIYEPFGIINLEAMACETPVVASAVGGIPEIVVDGETGRLVPLALAEGGLEPAEPARFERDLAEALNALLAEPERLARMGRAARARVEARFTWRRIAERTLAFYRDLTAA